jgi:hypothetical protein
LLEQSASLQGVGSKIHIKIADHQQIACYPLQAKRLQGIAQDNGVFPDKERVVTAPDDQIPLQHPASYGAGSLDERLKAMRRSPGP